MSSAVPVCSSDLEIKWQYNATTVNKIRNPGRVDIGKNCTCDASASERLIVAWVVYRTRRILCDGTWINNDSPTWESPRSNDYNDNQLSRARNAYSKIQNSLRFNVVHNIILKYMWPCTRNTSLNNIVTCQIQIIGIRWTRYHYKTSNCKLHLLKSPKIFGYYYYAVVRAHRRLRAIYMRQYYNRTYRGRFIRASRLPILYYILYNTGRIYIFRTPTLSRCKRVYDIPIYMVGYKDARAVLRP